MARLISLLERWVSGLPSPLCGSVNNNDSIQWSGCLALALSVFGFTNWQFLGVSICRADAHLRMIGGLATPPRTGSRSTVLPDNTAHPPRSLSRSLVPTAAPSQAKGYSLTMCGTNLRRPAADRTRITWRNSLSTPFARHERARSPDARSEGQTGSQARSYVVATRGGRPAGNPDPPQAACAPAAGSLRACRRRALRTGRWRGIEML